MQQAMYYPPNHKSIPYTPISRYETQTGPVYYTSYTPMSQSTCFQMNRAELRPLSHNVYTDSHAKQFPPLSTNQIKYSHQMQYPLKNSKTAYQKTIWKNSEIFRPSDGDMKNSYMGADAREMIYSKGNAYDPLKVAKMKYFPRLGQSYTSNKFDINSVNDKNQNCKQEYGSETKKNNHHDNDINIENNQYGLTYTASMSKINPKQKIKIRKNSYDQTESWLKSGSRKKNQKKFAISDFKRICELGTGKYGKVFLVKEKSTQFICALKIIQKQMVKDEALIQQFIRELKIQMFLDHPNIIKMYGFFEDSINIYIILQVALGGQLYKHLHRGVPMKEVKVANIIRQVISALNELHSHHIIHRDIKPQNIVMNQNILKLCDFGWSVYHGQALRTTFCGTPLYVSPEVLKGNNYDQKIDIWSLGIMMYEMLVGQNPFKITHEQQLIKIIKNSVSFPPYTNISKEAQDLVLSCLQKNPEDRANIRQLIHHDFFKKFPEKEKKVGV